MTTKYRMLGPDERKQLGDEWLASYGYWEPWTPEIKGDYQYRRPIKDTNEKA